MPTILFNLIPVDKGMIYWTDCYGYIEIWTQTKHYGDLVYQFGCNCPVDKNPYDLIMSNYDNNNMIWQGDDENV